ncbi:MAG: DUF4031 domain-containing protein [Micromonosporaceae bacterium]|nr:DUF4031 domain-containing protein [Micromonosporaceae bacterium]
MILIDLPRWPAHGRLWSHLISDTSLAELHAFAEALGAPRRGFDRDHYDIPAERYPVAVWLGARTVSSREIVAALYRNGLRRPKHAALRRLTESA